MGLQDKVGALKPGMLADVVAVPGNTNREYQGDAERDLRDEGRSDFTERPRRPPLNPRVPDLARHSDRGNLRHLAAPRIALLSG